MGRSMKPILLILFLTTLSYSQADSVYQKNLRLFISEYQFLDSAYNSALNEIKLCDSSVVIQFQEISKLKRVIELQGMTLTENRVRIAELEKPKIQWYVYGGVVFVYTILIYLVGYLSK